MPTIAWYAVVAAAVAVLASSTAPDAAEKCSRSSDLWSCLENGGDIPLAGRYLTLAADEEQDAAASSSARSTLSDFAGRRVLRVSVPLKFVARLFGGSSEARGKKDKGAGVMMLGGMMMMTTLASTAFGALALLAAKGLMTGVMALVLSAMAVSKKSGGQGHARTTYEVINAPHAGYRLAHAAAVSEVGLRFKKTRRYKRLS